MVTDWDWPGLFTTSIPLPVMVKVWEADPAFVTVMLVPFFTVKVVGVNTNPPSPCWRVTPASWEPGEWAPGELLAPDADVAAGWDGVVDGLELLLQAAPINASAAATPIKAFAPRPCVPIPNRSFRPAPRFVCRE